MTFTKKILLFSTLAGAMSLMGCMEKNDFLKQSSGQTQGIQIHPVKNDSGIYSGLFEANLYEDQSLKIDDPNLGETEITIPAGALAISTGISVQEGLSLATNALHGNSHDLGNFPARYRKFKIS